MVFSEGMQKKMMQLPFRQVKYCAAILSRRESDGSWHLIRQRNHTLPTK